MTPEDVPGPLRPDETAAERAEREAALNRLKETLAEHRAEQALDTVDDTRLRQVLELNGFNAIQTEALGVASAVAAIPLEALNAAIVYHDAAIARLRLNSAPEAKASLPIAERHGRYLTCVRRWRRELGDLEDRIDAAARITAP